MDFIDLIADGYVPVYLILIAASQILFAIVAGIAKSRRAKRRAQSGLPEDEMVSGGTRLESLRWTAGLQALLFVLTVVGVPVFFVLSTGEKQAAVVFIALLAMISVQVPEPVRHFIGGLAFKSLVAMSLPFQTGDRVVLKGIKGRVTDIGMFYVTLQTPDDDKVSLPTYSLWNETLASANAGDMGSMAVARVHLSPFCTPDRLRAAEGALSEAIHASAYLDITRPVNVFVSQTEETITLTAKAYVASTYDEPHFLSDVTRTFLAHATEEGIPLAHPREPSDAVAAPVRTTAMTVAA